MDEVRFADQIWEQLLNKLDELDQEINDKKQEIDDLESKAKELDQEALRKELDPDSSNTRAVLRKRTKADSIRHEIKGLKSELSQTENIKYDLENRKKVFENDLSQLHDKLTEVDREARKLSLKV
jgi:chromosome segregation ATPase